MNPIKQLQKRQYIKEQTEVWKDLCKRSAKVLIDGTIRPADEALRMLPEFIEREATRKFGV